MKRYGEFHGRVVLEWDHAEYRRAWWLLWLIHAPRIWYRIRHLDDGFWYESPLGEEIHPGERELSDLGSTPFFLHRIMPPEEFPGPYLIHDTGYRHKYLPRSVHDLYLYYGLMLCKAPRWKCHAAYWGVRLGGWYAWYLWRRHS